MLIMKWKMLNQEQTKDSVELVSCQWVWSVVCGRWKCWALSIGESEWIDFISDFITGIVLENW